MSKLTTQAPRFFSSLWSMANTSPSTTTVPKSSSSADMGMGSLRISCWPKISFFLGTSLFFSLGRASLRFFRAWRRISSVLLKASSISGSAGGGAASATGMGGATGAGAAGACRLSSTRSIR